MALLIAIELLTLRFAMNTLSSLRAFVEGEGRWSKAQKDAVQSLYQYAVTSDPGFYSEFRSHLTVPLGDRQARLEMMKPDPDLGIVRAGFLQGNVHPDDIDGLIFLLRRFHQVSYVSRAVELWTTGDLLIDDLLGAAANLDEAVKSRSVADVRQSVEKIRALNEKLTDVEVKFSQTLGEGSRWLEGLLLMTLFLAVLTIEGTGLLLTFSFSRNLNRSLTELTQAATAVGEGNFSAQATVRSRDELGQLAQALNRMTDNLRTSLGEQRRAEAANETKSTFLANMSHEIRTPLGVILGFIEILRDPRVPEADRQEYLNTIDRTGKNLSRIINDILDLSKVEAGRLDIEVTPFSFREFVDEISSMLQLRAKEQDTRLEFTAKSAVPAVISTDRGRLRQILVNVIGNALKFTHHGRIDVQYWMEPGRLTFDVSDSGAGMTEDQQAKLFQRFASAQSGVHPQQGAGLGLALSRGLARALGGDLALRSSQPGVGSTFRVTVAADPKAIYSDIHKEGETMEDLSILRGKKVLVVDDAPENQTIVRLFLARHGVEMEFASNGQEGIDKALAGDFDVVLMDIQMPVIDGYEATRTLRNKGFFKPIIALTAHAMKEDQEKCFEAGCTDYVSKPIESGVLATAVAAAASKPT